MKRQEIMVIKMALNHIILAAVALVMLVAPSGGTSGDIGTDSSDHSGVCLIDGESKTLSTRDYWILQEGYAIELKQISLDGKKLWVAITKDGGEPHGLIIRLPDIGRFTKDIGNQEHNPIINIEALEVVKSTEEATLLVYQYSDGVEATRGFISIASSPEGARIYLDDEHKSYTPRMLTGISPGSHTIRLEKPGYEDYIETVHVSAEDEIRVSVSLSASATEQAEETPDTEPDRGQMVPATSGTTQEPDATPSSMTMAEAAVSAPMPGTASAIIGLMMAAIVIGMKKGRRPPRITSFGQYQDTAATAENIEL